MLLPGGFGTLDEAFELLTLVQTGKAPPAPIVLLDVPGATYWQTWQAFVDRRAGDPGYISARRPRARARHRRHRDRGRRDHRFYANYHSLRFVDGRLVLRMLRAPSPEELAALNADFADIVVRGEIETLEASRAEINDDDHVDLHRIGFWFDRRNWARLRDADRPPQRPPGILRHARALTPVRCVPRAR